MAQFQYTAVNASGKRLNGIIGAASEDEARKQLNTLGISVLAIQKTAETGEKTQTQEPGTTADLDKFEFEAFDKTGRKVIGTIPASNRYKAFKRLRDEYEFEVGYVVELGASPEEKAKARRDDLSVLKAEYDAQAKEDPAVQKESTEEQVNPQFEEKRQAMLKKVDFILEKIKAVLAQYGDQIRPENKQIIQSYIDKLLRIKSSTNLDYIEHTSEELLKKVQDQELFLHKEKMKAQQASLKLQTQQLMADLHSAGARDQKNISDDLGNVYHKLNKSDSRFLKGVAQSLERFVPTPEEKELKDRIKAVGRQIWVFRKLWLTAPKEAKAEAKASITRVENEKTRIQQELKVLQMKRTKLRKAQRQKSIQNKGQSDPELYEPLLTEEINNFLGWLLGFYIIAYFASHYVYAKVFPEGNPLPGNFNLFDSNILRVMLLSIFLWYALLSLRIEYLRYKSWANALIIPLGFLINAGLIFNL